MEIIWEYQWQKLVANYGDCLAKLNVPFAIELKKTKTVVYYSNVCFQTPFENGRNETVYMFLIQCM